MKNLRHYSESEQTKLFDETGTFFAFGNEQFQKAIKPGVKYSSLGAGGYCPTENVKRLLTGLDEIMNRAIDQDVEENGAEKIIEREYFNFESQITISTENAEDALQPYVKRCPELFTSELMKSTFERCFNLAIEKDWF